MVIILPESRLVYWWILQFLVVHGASTGGNTGGMQAHFRVIPKSDSNSPSQYYTYHTGKVSSVQNKGSTAVILGEDAEKVVALELYQNGTAQTDLAPNTDGSSVEIVGMNFEYESDKKRIDYDKDGSPHITENLHVTIRLYGKFDNTTYFKLSKFHKCDDPSNHEKPVKVEVDPSRTMGLVNVVMPPIGELEEVFLCINSSSMPHFMRQEGVDKPWLVIKLEKPMLPLWLHLTSLVVLLSLSGLFAGLNLGLMSLNKTDLQIIMKTGTKAEQKYAAVIAPVREHGNFLLCCLVLSNVLVNCCLTILMDDLTSGVVTIITSTLAIVTFGEIIPQAICSRYGVAVGAKTIYVTKLFMCLTCPLAYPISRTLDLILGEEIGSVYTRERLKELLKVTKDHHGLEIEEVGIISGALDMKTKTVKDVMLSLDSVFMLPIEAVLDFETMEFIECQGYSRIPVYEQDRSNIVGLLNVKQLTLLDANDNLPLKTVISYYQNQLFFVFENTRLDYMFRTFREGNRGHMAFVQRINDDGSADPYYLTVGLVTFEDVLEELLQAEIMDECDIGKQEARMQVTMKRPLVRPLHLKRKPQVGVELPAPLALAAVQFLSTSVEPFSKQFVSISILQRLVKRCAVYTRIPKDKANQQLPQMFIYEAGKTVDYFVMILDGRVEVTVGKEKLSYEAGAFTTFGKDLLQDGMSVEDPQTWANRVDDSENPWNFTPDYTVKVITDLHYIHVKVSAYRAAVMATIIEKTNGDPSEGDKNWEEEIDKVMATTDCGESTADPQTDDIKES